jgi:hypothetical protein
MVTSICIIRVNNSYIPTRMFYALTTNTTLRRKSCCYGRRLYQEIHGDRHSNRLERKKKGDFSKNILLKPPPSLEQGVSEPSMPCWRRSQSTF